LEDRDYDNATKYAQEALRINPHDGYTLGLFIFMAYENQDYKAVIRTAKKSFKYDKTAKYNHTLYSVYAKALYHLGKNKEAIKQLDCAIKLAPNNKAYLNLKELMLAEKELNN